ncbi:hypothetical protein N656DRAFT_93098 [Canariomyces notabilis]|uniref:Uncharacterized protein n=1 Tax=Canariomyces notabilis TaxID=2074819 RepID=A0AAN6YS37_9PEZI|nr:hypothetical protein N656DRAFT_93098 [Canariomyces arenarius]
MGNFPSSAVLVGFPTSYGTGVGSWLLRAEFVVVVRATRNPQRVSGTAKCQKHDGPCVLRNKSRIEQVLCPYSRSFLRGYLEKAHCRVLTCAGECIGYPHPIAHGKYTYVLYLPATLHADMWLKRSHISAVSVSQSSFDNSRKAVVMLVPEKPNSEMGEVRQACIRNFGEFPPISQDQICSFELDDAH